MSESKNRARLVLWLRVLNALTLLFLAVAYWQRLDGLYALTIYPPVAWFVGGVAFTLIGSRRHRVTAFWVLAVAWITFFLTFADEPHQWIGLLHRGSPEDLRVISLNCAGGTPEAAQEAMATQPAIVLLQESPSREDIERTARRVYGREVSVLTGIDGSIVADGRIEPVALPRGTNDFIAAKVYLAGRGPIFVVSVRMLPPVFRIDYWSPECWEAYAQNHAIHREELAEIATWVRANAGELPVIVGGDMNVPPDPRVFRPLADWLDEATRDSGYTAVNEFPLARIDQIWVRGLRPVRSEAVRTVNSDHRMVRCWLGAGRP
jgi:vancomycin resistance protein VanJ